jgi:hypothetical protein
MTARRSKLVALLSAGMAIGIALAGTPAGAHVASWAHNWTAHIRPKADPRYLPGGNLPSGKTIRGVFRMSGNDQGAGLDFGASQISFGWTLRSAPTAHFVAAGATPPAQCPGSPSNPQAAPGHLCVYELNAANAQSRAVTSPLSRFGFGLTASSVADGTWVSLGTWAVRSP